ncbi:hypothetical protein CANARDRAFT_10492 [[Candida] arabinofermentans NRRL YB-2248]|uniref:Partial AB-hydrolase lipase domain-containing protein n=1 Tax=[Candida] arabinofermentans NRRL YB-2248 TaxID=983967 RepID=A0A1E4SSQ8_9ASCO|nr:hypothetical protein CANARDRAFT_10492 [[Candida] arabinofermentans NRRL YB-2248]
MTESCSRLLSNEPSPPPSPPPPTNNTNKFINYTTYIISNICCFIFLSILMILALISHFIRTYIVREHKYHKSSKLAYSTIPLKSKNLSYYVELMGFKLYEYKLITNDGFIIILQRIVDENSTVDPSNKPPILLIHGLLQSSGSFITSGSKSIAYLLIQSGYDVWLGNNRCGFNPNHINYNSKDPKMWDWDLNDMTKFDLTLFIDEILKHSKFNKVNLVGHSQGTCQIIMLISNEFQLNYESKINKCILLAPAIFGGELLNKKLFIKFISFLPNFIYNFFFGNTSFMPIMMLLRDLIVTSPIYGCFSYSMFSFLFDWNDYLWDRSLRSIHFIFSPNYSSSKLMKWWLSNDAGHGFKKGSCILNENQMWFNSKTPPIFMIIGGLDKLVDGRLLIQHLQKNEPLMNGKYQYMEIENYSHLDVLWSDDIIETIGENLLKFLELE